MEIDENTLTGKVLFAHFLCTITSIVTGKEASFYPANTVEIRLEVWDW